MTTSRSLPVTTLSKKTNKTGMNETQLNKSPSPSGSYSLTLRLKIRNLPGMLGKVTSLIGDTGSDIGAIDIHGFEKDFIVRDITVKVRDAAHGDQLVRALNQLADCQVVNVSDRTFLM